MASFMHIDYTDTKLNGTSTMVLVTTVCPTCEKEWKHYEYEEGLIVGLALAMCPECTRANSDEHGNALIYRMWEANA